MAPVTINRNTIDLDPRHHPHGFFSTDATESNFILVQYSHVPTLEDHNQLDRLKARIIERIGDHTLLCRYLPSDLGPIRALPFVDHAAVYHSDFVINPLVEQAKEKDGQIPVGVYVHSTCPEAGSDVWDTIKATIDPDARLIGHGKWSAKLWMKREKLAEVAALDHVWAIVPVNGHDLNSNKAVPWVISGLEAWPLNGALDGTGEIVAVADTGYANGFPSGPFGHPMFDHGRIVNMKWAGNPTGPQTDDMLLDQKNHGTGVAGCVAADWQIPAFPNMNPTPLATGLCDRLSGTAPGANLFIINCFQLHVEDTPLANLDNLWTIPYNDAGDVAKIYNCSWGTKTDYVGGRFQSVGYAAAEGVIDGSAIDDPELVIVFAATNKGALTFYNSHGETIYRQVVTEATSKNIITVGMTYDERWFHTGHLGAARIMEPSLVLDAAGSTTVAELNAAGTNPGNIRRYFRGSSRGPTTNGILKPEVVAAGAGIMMASGGPNSPSLPSPTTHPATCFDVGTSFAAPQVSGMAACLREALRHGLNPSVITLAEPPGMLIKALIVNGAQDLRDTVYETWTPDGEEFPTTPMPPTPNNAVGFGLVNLRRSLVSLTNDGGGIWNDALTDGEHSLMHDLTFPATNAANRDILKVTLTWADVPGADVQNYLQLKLHFDRSDGTSGDQDPDPLQLLPYEPAEPHRPVTTKQVVQRITFMGATRAIFPAFRVEVLCNDPIIGYHRSDGSIRLGQPFAVAWGFFTTI